MTGNISRILPVENEVNVDIAVNSMTFEESSRNLSKMVLKEKNILQQDNIKRRKLSSSGYAPALKI